MIRIKRGDRKAYDQIWNKYYPVVQDFLSSLKCHSSMADDVSQDVFARLWEYRERYQDHSTAKAYLFGLANNVLMEHLRRLSKQVPTVQNEVLDRCLGYADALSDPEASAYNAELAEIIEQTMSQLTAKQRQALNLIHFEGKSLKEAAQRANCTVEAFRSRIRRGPEKLRQLLDHVKPE